MPMTARITRRPTRFVAHLLPFALVGCGTDGPTDPDAFLSGIDPVGADGTCVVQNETFDDDVIVPRDAECEFTDVKIQGNLKLDRGARLTATRLEVDGNLQAQRAALAVVEDSEILGDLQFEQGGSVDLRRSRLDGNLQLEDNDGALTALDSVIEGDLQAFQNRSGPFLFSDNTIDGNLQCKENAPAPQGSGNIVGGNREDQCEGF